MITLLLDTGMTKQFARVGLMTPTQTPNEHTSDPVRAATKWPDASWDVRPYCRLLSATCTLQYRVVWRVGS